MQQSRARRVEVLGVVALVGLVLQGAGIAPVGQPAGLLAVAIVGHRTGRAVRDDRASPDLLQSVARRGAPALVLVTLLAAAWARASGAPAAAGEIRGALTWTWVGMGDVHAAVRSSPSWDLAAPVDPTAGLWVLSAAARPAALVLLLVASLGLPEARVRTLALAGVGLSLAAAALLLPGADGAHRHVSVELSTAASLTGVALALAPGRAGGWLPPTLRHRFPIDADLLLVGAVATVGLALDALDGDLDAPALALAALLVAIAAGTAIALVGEAVDRRGGSDDVLGAVLPPVALATILLLWQASGAFHTEPPVQTREREVESLRAPGLASSPYVEAALQEAGQRPPQEGQPRHQAQRGPLSPPGWQQPREAAHW